MIPNDIIELIANYYIINNESKDSINLALTSKNIYNIWNNNCKNKLSNCIIDIKEPNCYQKCVLKLDNIININVNTNNLDINPIILWEICKNTNYDYNNKSFDIYLNIECTNKYINWKDKYKFKLKLLKSKFLTKFKNIINLSTCSCIYLSINLDYVNFLWNDLCEI